MQTLEKPPRLSEPSKRILDAISSPERYGIMLALNRHKKGLSFSQLATVFSINNNTLDRHLKTLTQSTLLWNFYERRQGKDHSFYKLSALGERLLGALTPELETAA